MTNIEYAKKWAELNRERMKEMPSSHDDAWDNLAECFLALMKECEEYKSALEFYGDKSKYLFHTPMIYHHDRLKLDIVTVRGGVAEDDGKRAREVLNKWEKEKI